MRIPAYWEHKTKVGTIKYPRPKRNFSFGDLWRIWIAIKQYNYYWIGFDALKRLLDLATDIQNFCSSWFIYRQRKMLNEMIENKRRYNYIYLNDPNKANLISTFDSIMIELYLMGISYVLKKMVSDPLVDEYPQLNKYVIQTIDGIHQTALKLQEKQLEEIQ